MTLAHLHVVPQAQSALGGCLPGESRKEGSCRREGPSNVLSIASS
jgi:hypothetical protein